MTAAQMVRLPRSSGPVVHDPSRQKPVRGSAPHGSSSEPRSAHGLSIADRQDRCPGARPQRWASRLVLDPRVEKNTVAQPTAGGSLAWVVDNAR